MDGHHYYLSLFFFLFLLIFVTGLSSKAHLQLSNETLFSGQQQRQHYIISSEHHLLKRTPTNVQKTATEQKLPLRPHQQQPVLLINGQHGSGGGGGAGGGGGRRTPPNPGNIPGTSGNQQPPAGQPAMPPAPIPGIDADPYQNMQAFYIGQLQNGLNPAQAFVLTTQHIAGPLVVQHQDQVVGLSARMQQIHQNNIELVQRHLNAPLPMPLPVRGNLLQGVENDGYQATLNRAVLGQPQQQHFGGPRRGPVSATGDNYMEELRLNVDPRLSDFQRRRHGNGGQVQQVQQQLQHVGHQAVARGNHVTAARWIRAHRQGQRAQGRRTPLLGWQAPPRYQQPAAMPVPPAPPPYRPVGLGVQPPALMAPQQPPAPILSLQHGGLQSAIQREMAARAQLATNAVVQLPSGQLLQRGPTGGFVARQPPATVRLAPGPGGRVPPHALVAGTSARSYGQGTSAAGQGTSYGQGSYGQGTSGGQQPHQPSISSAQVQQIGQLVSAIRPPPPPYGPASARRRGSAQFLLDPNPGTSTAPPKKKPRLPPVGGHGRQTLQGRLLPPEQQQQLIGEYISGDPDLQQAIAYLGTNRARYELLPPRQRMAFDSALSFLSRFGDGMLSRSQLGLKFKRYPKSMTDYANRMNLPTRPYGGGQISNSRHAAADPQTMRRHIGNIQRRTQQRRTVNSRDAGTRSESPPRRRPNQPFINGSKYTGRRGSRPPSVGGKSPRGGTPI